MIDPLDRPVCTHTQNGPRPDALVVALQEALDSLRVLNWGLFG